MNNDQILFVRETIGREYVTGAFASENSSAVKKAFNIISEVNRELFKHIPFDVIFTVEDTYQTAKQMREDFKKNQRVYIYTEYSGHPFLDHESNSIGRAVHDIYAHLVCGCPFTFQGEYNAYLEQRKHYPEEVWAVLFAEIPAQTCAYYYSGGFTYKQRAFAAPDHWMEMCNGLTFDYSKNSVLGRVEMTVQTGKSGMYNSFQ